MKKKEEEKKPYKSLIVEYAKYRTQLTEKFQNRKAYQEKDPKLVLAFIPGTIRKINVKEGDAVKKGDLLLILEAMKMKNRILSPMDGTIKSVNVKTGNIVPKNETLIAFE
jgi:biotin carboxyl carrier protein